MADLSMGGFTVKDAEEGGLNLPMALVGAAGGALLMAVVYGVVGRFVGEFSYVAFLIGGVAGLGSMKLGGGRSIVAGIAAAGIALVAVILAKLIVGSPEGVSWIGYHTTLFDIIFCYVLNPAAAFLAAGTEKARDIAGRFLPV